MGECIVCNKRPVANAPDAAVCGVCMLEDLRRIMDERNTAERALAAANARADEALANLDEAAMSSQGWAQRASIAEESLAAARRQIELLSTALAAAQGSK